MNTTTNGLTLRPGRADDVAACATICFEAFVGINRQHGFPPDFTDSSHTTGLMSKILASEHVSSVVAERDGRIVGSGFLWHGTIGGIGPITVDPTAQAAGVGRAMMQRILDIAAEKRMAGTRLVQAGFNMRSLSLYTSLGFDVREHLACMNGDAKPQTIDGLNVRAMAESDVEECCDLCMRVHGHDRRGELHHGLREGTGRVVESAGRIRGYATDIGFFAHAVALGNLELMALIGTTEKITGPGLLLPSRNGEVFRWCLSRGLRVIQPMTLMSRGLYTEPRGAFFPSILL